MENFKACEKITSDEETLGGRSGELGMGYGSTMGWGPRSPGIRSSTYSGRILCVKHLTALGDGESGKLIDRSQVLARGLCCRKVI